MSNSALSRIVVIGAFDTKANEYAFLRDAILRQGGKVLTVNIGVLGTTDLFPVDIEADEVARAGGGDLETLRANQRPRAGDGHHGGRRSGDCAPPSRRRDAWPVSSAWVALVGRV